MKTIKTLLISACLIPLVIIGLAQFDWRQSCDAELKAAADGSNTEVSAIIAFAFGNRKLEDGTMIPGPINRELAKLTHAIYSQTQSPVYAQWEIADTITGTIPADSLHAIRPLRDPEDGSEIYLSTAGIIETIISQAGDPSAMGPVYVVAHQDHLCRCIGYLRERGFDAYAVPLTLPAHYDAQSDQPWTRSVKVYRLVDRLASFF